MFSKKHIDELIRLGWAPQFDDDMQIVGFDKWVKEGEPVIRPAGCGDLVRYAALEFDAELKFVKRQKYGVLPRAAKRFA